ncbi:MAG: hypothetical protein HC814_08200 [Rhodobacteraceae bacterium]|nr:hypothetical protein [Paracoccaceae bacterium]
MALATGTQTINGADKTLTITSGGIIVSNAALTVNTRINVGANELIVNIPDGAANRVVTLNGPLTGSAGLILDGQNTSDRLDLRGTNDQFTGTIYIHGAQLRLLSPLAVSKNNDLHMSGGFFRLNTNNVEIGSLSGETGTIDNNTVGSSTLTINQSVAGQFNGNITNSGTAGSIMLVTKNGSAELRLGGVNPFTGDFLVNEGTVRLNGGGAVSSTNVVINSRGTLIVDQSAGNNNNRLRDAGTGIAVQMNGGTLQFTGNAGGTSTESMGTLVLNSGNSTINAARANSGQTHNRTFSSLVRSNGSTLGFIDNNLGDDARNRIIFTAAPALTNNIIGAWTVVSNDWATYAADVDGAGGAQPSVTNLAGAQYNSGAETGWAVGDNARMTAATLLTGDRTVNTLNMDADLDLGGNTLTLTAGGVLKTGANSARSLTNGTISPVIPNWSSG